MTKADKKKELSQSPPVAEQPKQPKRPKQPKQPRPAEQPKPPKRPKQPRQPKPRKPAPAAELGPVLAGFHSDSISIKDKDKVNIEGVVEAFCSVMLSRKVHPPLSIGLFGDWGSGKSFFMEEMWRQVDKVAAQAKKEDNPHWHGHVAQIRFNAWHYSDANLWASFVTHIFDELAKIIQPGESIEETRSGLLQNLETSQALRKEAEYELAGAHAALRQRQGELRRARNNLQAKGLHDRIRVLLGDLAVAGNWETAQHFATAVDEAKSIDGRLRGLWSNFHRGRSRKALVFVVFLPALYIGADVVRESLGPEAVSGTLDRMNALWLQLVTFAGGVGHLLRSAMKKFNEVEEIRGRLTTLAEEREDEHLKPIQDDLDALQTGVTQAEAAAVRAERRVSDAELAVWEASAGRRFYRFIEERATSQDYRKHLGLISMVHRDFEQLEELLKDCEQYRPKKQGGEVEAAGEQEKVAKIERIILYIDDLDRCRPEVVVETLQAVHLLLALRLFVVVVGVDSRWLLRALEVHYPEFLAVGSRRRVKKAQESKDRNTDKEQDESAATTPQNYLEKIFQIPFCLPEMEKDGFGNLIDALANPKEETTEQKDAEALKAAGPTLAAVVAPLRSPRKDPGAPQPAVAGPKATEGPSSQPAPITASQQPLDPPARQKDPARPAAGLTQPAEPEKPLRSPQVLSISDDEREFMKLLHPLIETPRATKRFVNVYRLLRAV